ncbi:Dual specificity phosphatase, catalytic [Giardia duodenalis]|uniref:Dual specificity phosphatase, catalytic n=1 Tax=Giardia intestinalis (strain ATCC 50803 / WB clone C6) TaxID=184922 RepID=A8BS30_GIAIC|nr:Dual specificity phosphatase, catalytic [Giardia intestinalis]KAE8304737.1 Dual specificity phosphatase, catalytic [Giardia intestinalis]|eukprot:XP_001705137.1 Dual specificity phosphatase, catalytic [Giardia lamblia ATCC 50803]
MSDSSRINRSDTTSNDLLKAINVRLQGKSVHPWGSDQYSSQDLPRNINAAPPLLSVLNSEEVGLYRFFPSELQVDTSVPLIKRAAPRINPKSDQESDILVSTSTSIPHDDVVDGTNGSITSDSSDDGELFRRPTPQAGTRSNSIASIPQSKPAPPSLKPVLPLTMPALNTDTSKEKLTLTLPLSSKGQPSPLESGLKRSRPMSMSEDKALKIKQYDAIMSKITEFLYLSSLTAAQNTELLQKNKITHVINCCLESQSPKYGVPNLACLLLKLRDTGLENIDSLFLEAIAFIHEARMQGKAVLVHCYQGVSRSASLVIAYIMWANDLSYEEAYSHVRSCRGVVAPNTGFVFRLVSWWRRRHSDLTTARIAAKYAEEHAVKGIISLEEGCNIDAAIQGIRGSHLIKCTPPEELHSRPALYRLAPYNDMMPDMIVLKPVDTVIKNGKPNFLLDERFIYVAPLPCFIIIFIGAEVDTLHDSPEKRQYLNVALNRQLTLLRSYEGAPSQTVKIFQRQLRNACISILKGEHSYKATLTVPRSIMFRSSSTSLIQQRHNSNRVHTALAVLRTSDFSAPKGHFLSQHKYNILDDYEGRFEMTYEKVVTYAAVALGMLGLIKVEPYDKDNHFEHTKSQILGSSSTGGQSGLVHTSAQPQARVQVRTEILYVEGLYEPTPVLYDLASAALAITDTTIWSPLRTLDVDASIISRLEKQ